MYLDLSDLFWLTLMVLLLLHWWQSLKVKEVALKAASSHCKELDLQLLDQSVYLRGLWLKRDQQGKIRIWRSYLFDFTATGDDRAKGRIVLLGLLVTGITLEAHRI
ncbi:DUF3301 domain-containing protein [Amphritea sp. 1_MG-2023]|uniref:DUF3301 domain-containing protein n=1 Tax=Amphritea sp. 1_MG-2023 TaxID=3062670 RepID=UPI0026E38055|nr:DUF3301 domain-containing protein [Amphritea sp. 1_MG-2023]MDO6562114.1 DUF3301 domain-containing protein [Amphritea sp. 1_MG-2023]